MDKLTMNLQLFAENATVETGVEAAPAAGGQQQAGGSADQTGVEGQAVAEPQKQNNFEKAFAKRLAQEREKWEAEKRAEIEKIREQYKDYDFAQKAIQYLQKQFGVNDISALKEQLEFEELQEKAFQQNVPVEVMKRLQELEAKAAKFEELQRQKEEEKAIQEYFNNLNEFAKAKGIEAEKLNQFMIENDVWYNPQNPQKSFEIAWKAMRHDELVKELEEAEKRGVKNFLQAKGSIPNVPDSTNTGQFNSPAPKTFEEARARAMQRISSGE